MTQREDMGREVREGVQDWQLMYTRGGFMSIHGKTNTALLSKIKKKIIKSLQTINARQGVEKRELSCTVGRNVN